MGKGTINVNSGAASVNGSHLSQKARKMGQPLLFSRTLKSKAAGGGARSTQSKSSLREFQAVGLGKEVPGFAVGVVDVAFAAAFGVEGEGG